MHETAIEMAGRLLGRLEREGSRLVIDADCHATDIASLTGDRRERYESSKDYYHGRPLSAEDLIAEMRMAGVNMALIWQNPAATAYTDDPEFNAESLLAANRYIRDSALRYPDRFIPAGWVDPKACGMENTFRMVDTLVREFGFALVKMNPAQNQFPIDGQLVMAVVDHIVKLGAVPVFHFGADTPYTPAEGLRAIAERHPRHPVMGVHMGGGGAGYMEAEELYGKARALGLEQPNVRYAISAKRDTHIESDLISYTLAGEPFSNNLFCASDAPYGRMTWNFGGFRAMFRSLIDHAGHTDSRVRARPGLFTPEVAQRYLGGNFARFAAESYRRLLTIQKATLPVCH